MNRRRSLRRIASRLAGLTSGAMLLQVTGCAVDDTVATELANVLLDVILASLNLTV